MQPWTRSSSICWRCASRQHRFSSTPAKVSPTCITLMVPKNQHSARTLSSTATVSYKSRNSKSDSQFYSKHGKSAEGVKITRRSAPPSNTRVRPRLSKDQMIDEVYHALKKTKLRLEREIVDDDPTQIKTNLKVLDPEGRMWSAFKEQILSTVEHYEPRHRSPKTSPQLARLVRAAHQDMELRQSTNLATEIYFEFLDFCLEPLSSTDLGDSSAIVDVRYPTEWYLAARQSQRTIHLHVGPTNSGKTYNALKRLQESKNGFYAGPLRLLAHEVYSRFRANGIPCDLVTGDDVRLDENADTKVYASTVEMVKTNQEVDVAVIDEIQMMSSADRGWAWTRAFLGANAKEVHLCGETRVVPMIRELAASMGDALKIHRYERLNKLQVAQTSLKGDLQLLRKGDCVVAFSIMQLHALKRDIEVKTGKRCAIVYGSLPPETRAAQADLFNDPNNDYDYLVASDAIGMGLNLSVKRIIFHTVTKWDGKAEVELTVPQIKQIAGRAGRYRSAHQDKTGAQAAEASDNVGIVTCLNEMDLPVVRNALDREPPPLRRAGIVPPAEYLEEYSSRLPVPVPFEFLVRKVAHEAAIHPRFFLCDIDDTLALARLIDDIPHLSIEQRVHLTAAPASRRDRRLAKAFRTMAQVISRNQSVTVADLHEIPFDVLSESPRAEREYLEMLEALHKCIILYLWLSYRFPMNLRDQPMAMHAKEITEKNISWTLKAFSANPKLRAKLQRRQETTVLKRLDLSNNDADSASLDTDAASKLLEQTEDVNAAQGEDFDDGSRFEEPKQSGSVDEADNFTSDETIATPQEETAVQNSFNSSGIAIGETQESTQRAGVGAG